MDWAELTTPALPLFSGMLPVFLSGRLPFCRTSVLSFFLFLLYVFIRSAFPLSLPAFLSVNIPARQLPVFQPVCLPVFQPGCLPVFQPVCLPVFQPVCLPVFQPVCLSACIPACLSVCLFSSLFVCPCSSLSVCISVSLSLYLSCCCLFLGLLFH